VAELVLHRLQQVVGLVGDVEVGVAGDLEVPVVEHLGAGEERIQVRGDHVLERDERAVALADREEAPEQLLRHLHAGDDLVAAVGVAQQHREAEREVGDVGEGPPHADHQRGEGREDLVVEAGPDLLALGLARAVQGEDLDPVLLEGGAKRPLEAPLQPLVEVEGSLPNRRDLLARRQPVRTARVDAGVHLVPEPGDPDHEELVQVGRVDRAELDPLEQRHGGVLGQLQNPLVEVEPGELAVEVEAGLLQVGPGRGLAAAALKLALGEDVLFQHRFLAVVPGRFPGSAGRASHRTSGHPAAGGIPLRRLHTVTGCRAQDACAASGVRCGPCAAVAPR
jgi:hypothetical protein